MLACVRACDRTCRPGGFRGRDDIQAIYESDGTRMRRGGSVWAGPIPGPAVSQAELRPACVLLSPRTRSEPEAPGGKGELLRVSLNVIILCSDERSVCVCVWVFASHSATLSSSCDSAVVSALHCTLAAAGTATFCNGKGSIRSKVRAD